MKVGIILQTNEPERVWNGLRLANTALKQGHEVRLFLMGAGVEIEAIDDAKFNVLNQLQEFTASNGIVMACGTCLKSRHQEASEMCPISNMVDCVEMVEWADKVITI